MRNENRSKNIIKTISGLPFFSINDLSFLADKKVCFPAKEIISDENNIVCVEWPVEEILPKKIVRVKIEAVDENKRKITIDYGK